MEPNILLLIASGCKGALKSISLHVKSFGIGLPFGSTGSAAAGLPIVELLAVLKFGSQTIMPGQEQLTSVETGWLPLMPNIFSLKPVKQTLPFIFSFVLSQKL